MSGVVKAGLLVGLLGLFLVAAVAFVPLAGVPLCAPVVAIGLGVLAGWLALRWAPDGSGAGRGALAGALAGVGMLIGVTIYFIVAVMLIQSTPEMQQAMQEMVAQQQPGTELSPEQLSTLINIAGPVGGVCCGLIYLLIAMGGGALGGWLVTRNRPQGYQPPPQGPTTPPSYGPPPLSPQ